MKGEKKARKWGEEEPSGVAKLYGPECGLSSGPAFALLDCAAWECPPSRGDACTDPNVDSRRGPHRALLDRAAWSERPPSRGGARRTRVREGVATYHFTTRRSRADKLPWV
ncbi:hypothetical protein CDL15_Pgr001045 [Punica granatum]|uniref:Uncharacterized protein n=1 Tax=Punica granatum TaxID=22663 RepID=A0A218X028_PUNGR|nr:hypothetical protein CDL15_Pgr001045 [Punica granatum]